MDRKQDFALEATGKVRARPNLPLAAVIGAGAMGMAIARRLGERHRLALADKDAEHLKRQVATLTEEGHDVQGVICDVTDPAAVAKLAGKVSAQGPLRVLAHVVGLSPSMADWQTIMMVNLVGPTLVADALLPLAGRGTAAIFIASVTAYTGPFPTAIISLMDQPLTPGFLEALEVALGERATSTLAYRLSKFALIRMCERRVSAWGKRGARIVSLSPGLIVTPMGALEFKHQPLKYDMLANTPLGREGTLLEIADAVDFLASERASFISGIDLLVDGGLAAAMKEKRILP